MKVILQNIRDEIEIIEAEYQEVVTAGIIEYKGTYYKYSPAKYDAHPGLPLYVESKVYRHKQAFVEITHESAAPKTKSEFCNYQLIKSSEKEFEFKTTCKKKVLCVNIGPQKQRPTAWKICPHCNKEIKFNMELK